MSKENIQSYTAYIKHSPHWRLLRARKLEANPRCEYCAGNQNLHVHHIRYRAFFDCDLSDLMTLCEVHHNVFHLAKDCLGWSVDSAEETLGLIRHFVALPKEEQSALKKERKVTREMRRDGRIGRKKFRLAVLEVLSDFRHGRIDTRTTKDLIESLKRLVN